MADLDEGQWELDGLVMGWRTPIQVTSFEVSGVDIRAGDLDVPGGDGRVFGYDYAGGRTITLGLSIDTESGEQARAVWSQLATRWRDPAVRLSPRAVVPLRIRDYGMDTVIAYGRPRQLDPVNIALLDRGRVDFTASFETVDDLFYADPESGGDGSQTVTLDLLPQIGEGLILPFTLPAVLTPLGDSDAAILVNAGDSPAYPVITFTGPVTNPAVEWMATGVSARLATTLAYDQTATIDARPWARTVLRSDGASLAGALRGPRLADLTIPPGRTEVRFTGQDATGTARATITLTSARSAL